MACFVVPAAEAVITTVAQKVLHKKGMTSAEKENSIAVKFSEKLGLLNKLLWGGSALLCFEHIWHGEIVPFFPFLTAAQTPESAAAMLNEMAVSGTAMAVLITGVWAVIVTAGSVIVRKADKEEK